MIRFRAPAETIARWEEAAKAKGLELNDWIRYACEEHLFWIEQTMDTGGLPLPISAYPPQVQLRAEKSQEKKGGLSEEGGEHGVSVGEAPQDPGTVTDVRAPSPSESPFTAPEIVEIGAGEKPESKISKNLFKAKQDARKKWDRQYKKLPPEIQEAWAEENPRP